MGGAHLESLRFHFNLTLASLKTPANQMENEAIEANGTGGAAAPREPAKPQNQFKNKGLGSWLAASFWGAAGRVSTAGWGEVGWGGGEWGCVGGRGGVPNKRKTNINRFEMGYNLDAGTPCMTGPPLSNMSISEVGTTFHKNVNLSNSAFYGSVRFVMSTTIH